jgi:hypothetical protein
MVVFPSIWKYRAEVGISSGDGGVCVLSLSRTTCLIRKPGKPCRQRRPTDHSLHELITTSIKLQTTQHRLSPLDSLQEFLKLMDHESRDTLPRRRINPGSLGIHSPICILPYVCKLLSFVLPQIGIFISRCCSRRGRDLLQLFSWPALRSSPSNRRLPVPKCSRPQSDASTQYSLLSAAVLVK